MYTVYTEGLHRLVVLGFGSKGFYKALYIYIYLGLWCGVTSLFAATHVSQGAC